MQNFELFTCQYRICFIRSSYFPNQHRIQEHNCMTTMLSFANLQEHVLTGGHGLMVNGYDPVIKALARDLDIHLNHRCAEELCDTLIVKLSPQIIGLLSPLCVCCSGSQRSSSVIIRLLFVWKMGLVLLQMLP